MMLLRIDDFDRGRRIAVEQHDETLGLRPGVAHQNLADLIVHGRSSAARTGIETALASEAASSATSAPLCFESLMWASHQRVSRVLHLMG